MKCNFNVNFNGAGFFFANFFIKTHFGLPKDFNGADYDFKMNINYLPYTPVAPQLNLFGFPFAILILGYI